MWTSRKIKTKEQSVLQGKWIQGWNKKGCHKVPDFCSWWVTDIALGVSAFWQPGRRKTLYYWQHCSIREVSTNQQHRGKAQTLMTRGQRKPIAPGCWKIIGIYRVSCNTSSQASLRFSLLGVPWALSCVWTTVLHQSLWEKKSDSQKRSCDL